MFRQPLAISHLKAPGGFWACAALALLIAQPAPAQVFDSGSTGADGALVLDTPGTVVFDPQAFVPILDGDGDGVYHFTTVNVAAGVTVKLTADVLGTRPVVWLAEGDVVIAGIVDLNGEEGHQGGEPRLAAVPGAGGFHGGLGGTALLAATAGSGPGAGLTGSVVGVGNHGGGGGYGTTGASAGHSNGAGGPTYGNRFLIPLLGGSGGGGANGAAAHIGGGGGAGGGAILIASSTRIVVDGSIEASGGEGGPGLVIPSPTAGGYWGGGGSGGGIRLMAPAIEGTGSILAAGGELAYPGGNGRVRIEAFAYDFLGIPDPITSFSQHLGPVFTTPETTFSVRLARIAGVDVPPVPTGSFDPADLVLETTGEVLLEVEASQVPLGTVVQLTLNAESGDRIAIESTPLAGTLESSTATAGVVIPPGFSRFTVMASWEP